MKIYFDNKPKEITLTVDQGTITVTVKHYDDSTTEWIVTPNFNVGIHNFTTKDGYEEWRKLS